ncbi:LacI family DNA-binding transcriptional regulator [Halpernia frigidisoli]|uniref:Transcriptional regulator, LacI family n=1 Tax=Halpernia frigidisoli TaxID=1125876 RepID=A0A1I3IWA0_9FLAO|nr:LacI family DNA-binding transcriptional regulator [Halpernia frigidisoli]SFI52231.1 transcriptional regulator, LacI family [Halpernia frigidisoli]
MVTNKKNTIYDIADQLNISVATVSRALNNKTNISPTTKELVLKAAEKMGYEQNKLALALKSGKSKTVGVIVPRVDSSFFGSIITGIEEELNAHNYSVIICQTHGDPKKEIANIDTLLNSQVDAVFISTSMKDVSALERVLKKGVSLIFFDRKKTMENVSSVTINDFQGGYSATQHLINTGSKRIAYFSGDLDLEIFQERLAGYKHALSDNGIEYNENYIFRTESNIDEGKKAAKKLLKLNPLPDAIFSSSDFAALGAIQELRANNLNIPEDLSVIGFANEPFTQFMELSISTVDQFPLKMGRMTAKVFLEQEENPTNMVIHKKVVLEPELILRKSTKK